MAARQALAREILLNELPVAGGAETGEVAAVDDRHRQIAETVHRCNIIFAV